MPPSWESCAPRRRWPRSIWPKFPLVLPLRPRLKPALQTRHELVRHSAVDNAVIKSNSVGSIKAADFVVQTMDIDNDGVGSAEVNAAKELKVKESFLGKVRNAGSATAKRINKVVI